MLRWLVSLLAVAAASCGGVAAAQDDAPILVISTPPDASSTMLARVDPGTLAPVAPGFDLGEYHDAWAFSPDGRTLAVGTFVRTGLRLIDPSTLRPIRDVPLPIAAIGVGWVDAERVAVLLQSGGVVLVDTRRGRIVRRWPLSYGLPCAGRRQATTPHGVVFVVATPELRLLRIDRAGLAVVSLDRARSPSSRRACGAPALAVEPSGRRAFVAGSHGPAAVVDLRSRRVSYRRELAGPCRVRQCTARRTAVWTDTLAVADSVGGLRAVDPTTWASRRVDRSAGDVATMPDGSLLVFGGSRPGLRAARWTALAGARLRTVLATEHRVYALDAAGTATYVLDAASGRLLATLPGRARLDVVSPSTPPRAAKARAR